MLNLAIAVIELSEGGITRGGKKAPLSHAWPGNSPYSHTMNTLNRLM